MSIFKEKNANDTMLICKMAYKLGFEVGYFATTNFTAG